jgi:hypothetical protein
VGPYPSKADINEEVVTVTHCRLKLVSLITVFRFIRNGDILWHRQSKQLLGSSIKNHYKANVRYKREFCQEL